MRRVFTPPPSFPPSRCSFFSHYARAESAGHGFLDSVFYSRRLVLPLRVRRSLPPPYTFARRHLVLASPSLCLYRNPRRFVFFVDSSESRPPAVPELKSSLRELDFYRTALFSSPELISCSRPPTQYLELFLPGACQGPWVSPFYQRFLLMAPFRREADPVFFSFPPCLCTVSSVFSRLPLRLRKPPLL